MLQIEPLGDCALIIQFADKPNSEVEAQITNFQKLLDKTQIASLVEYVPAYTTVTVIYDPNCPSLRKSFSPYQSIKEDILKLLKQNELTNTIRDETIITIPVCYGGSFGPDLESVAKFHAKPVEEVISLHTNEIYTVSMIGFAPGFPYLSGLNETLATPRLKTPRKKVIRGSVGIAGIQTGIYSLDSPGGWQIIGRTPTKLFNYQEKQPSLLKHGDKVKFVRITEAQFNDLEEKQSNEYRS